MTWIPQSINFKATPAELLNQYFILLMAGTFCIKRLAHYYNVY